jgi:hypothetical protein
VRVASHRRPAVQRDAGGGGVPRDAARAAAAARAVHAGACARLAGAHAGVLAHGPHPAPGVLASGGHAGRHVGQLRGRRGLAGCRRGGRLQRPSGSCKASNRGDVYVHETLRMEYTTESSSRVRRRAHPLTPLQEGATSSPRVHTHATFTIPPFKTLLAIPGGWAACGVAPLVDRERRAA